MLLEVLLAKDGRQMCQLLQHRVGDSLEAFSRKSWTFLDDLQQQIQTH